MKKWLTMLSLAALILSMACAGLGETLYVDNRETDKIYPERLNLRAEPSKTARYWGFTTRAHRWTRRARTATTRRSPSAA